MSPRRTWRAELAPGKGPDDHHHGQFATSFPPPPLISPGGRLNCPELRPAPRGSDHSPSFFHQRRPEKARRPTYIPTPCLRCGGLDKLDQRKLRGSRQARPTEAAGVSTGSTDGEQRPAFAAGVSTSWTNDDGLDQRQRTRPPALAPGVMRTGWPVGRVLSPASRGATIHLRVPLPTPSSGLPAHSGGPPSNVRASRASTGLLDLAPSGVYRAGRVTPVAGGLLHHRFTLTPPRRSGERRSVLCGTVPRVTPGGCYPPLCPVEPGPSSGSCLHAVARPAHPRLKDSGERAPAPRRTTSPPAGPPRHGRPSPPAQPRRWRRGRAEIRC